MVINGNKIVTLKEKAIYLDEKYPLDVENKRIIET